MKATVADVASPQPDQSGHYFSSDPAVTSAPAEVELVLPEGRLIRLEVSLASNINGAWSDFVNYLDNDPESMSLPSGYVLEGYRVLARDVREFRLAPEDETLLFDLQLRRREAARMTGSEARDETLELHLEATPLNG